jgi:hypothetical protein
LGASNFGTARPGSGSREVIPAPIDVRLAAITHLMAREPRGFQRLHRFSPNPNIYNKPGNLPSLKQQPQPLEQIEFGHSFGTVEWGEPLR